jgi:hypothetical protein
LVLTAVVVVGTWLLWKGKEKDISKRIEKQKLETQLYEKTQARQRPTIDAAA